MQSSRARRVYSPLPLRLRLHNAGDYPTCQMVAAVPGRFTLRVCPLLRSDVDLLCPLSALPLATGQAFTIASVGFGQVRPSLT